MNTKHEWTVGDLCTCVYNERGYGIIYRVSAIRPSQNRATLEVVPVFGLLQDISKRMKRTGLDERYCKPLSLIDMSMQYLNLGNMISEEAKRRGAAATTPD